MDESWGAAWRIARPGGGSDDGGDIGGDIGGGEVRGGAVCPVCGDALVALPLRYVEPVETLCPDGVTRRLSGYVAETACWNAAPRRDGADSPDGAGHCSYVRTL